MINLLATLGSYVGASAFSVLWLWDEPDCPKSLIK